MSNKRPILIGIGAIIVIVAIIALGGHKKTTTTPQDDFSYTNGAWKIWQDGFSDKTNPTQYWGYQIQYPRDFEVATGDAATGGNFLEAPAVKISFPADAFKTQKTNFGGAFISLSYATGLTDTQCYERVNNPGEQMTQTATIRQTTFHADTASDAGAGNFYHSQIYRAIVRDVCFELVETLHTTNLANYEPGTRTEFDPQQTQSIFDQITDTLSFTDKNPNL